MLNVSVSETSTTVPPLKKPLIDILEKEIPRTVFWGQTLTLMDVREILYGSVRVVVTEEPSTS